MLPVEMLANLELEVATLRQTIDGLEVGDQVPLAEHRAFLVERLAGAERHGRALAAQIARLRNGDLFRNGERFGNG